LGKNPELGAANLVFCGAELQAASRKIRREAIN
jgi:hypothetical protein